MLHWRVAASPGIAVIRSGAAISGCLSVMRHAAQRPPALTAKGIAESRPPQQPGDSNKNPLDPIRHDQPLRAGAPADEPRGDRPSSIAASTAGGTAGRVAAIDSSATVVARHRTGRDDGDGQDRRPGRRAGRAARGDDARPAAPAHHPSHPVAIVAMEKSAAVLGASGAAGAPEEK